MEQNIEKYILNLYKTGTRNYSKIATLTKGEFNIKKSIRTLRRKVSKIVKDEFDGKPPRILVYDIETSQAEFKFKRFWTGKLNMYLNTRDMIKEPQVITIAYKWFGDNEVHTLKWKDKCDKKLIQDFLEVYNKADMLVGYNNDRFDNRWVIGRAMKYGFDINTFTKSFDLLKQIKKLARIPGYSMEFACEFFGLPKGKHKHRGIGMWNDLEDNPDNTKIYKDAMEEMIFYNVEDILRTEDLYNRLRLYMSNVTHLGAVTGKHKSTCPECGSEEIELYDTIFTKAGTVQRIMECTEDNVRYKISNSDYLKLTNL